MNGWSSHAGAGGWDAEPAWIYEITWEWEPLPGQRYPGDPGRRRVVHTPVYEASRAAEDHGVGRATVGSPPEWSGESEGDARRDGYPAEPDGSESGVPAEYGRRPEQGPPPGSPAPYLPGPPSYPGQSPGRPAQPPGGSGPRSGPGEQWPDP